MGGGYANIQITIVFPAPACHNPGNDKYLLSICRRYVSVIVGLACIVADAGGRHG
jgi:hypothetical protein